MKGKTSAHQQVQEPDRQHNQPPQKSLLARDASEVAQVGRSRLRRPRNLLPVPPFTPSGFNVNDMALRA